MTASPNDPSNPTPPDVLFELHGGVALITLNRPHRMNAMGGTLKEDFAAAMKRADADDAVRVVVVTGAGPAFCAGGDVKEMNEGRGKPRSLKEKIAPSRDDMLLAIFEAAKPVIAAVNGAAVGAGMNVALAADIRIASSAARFGQAFVKRGLPPDSGGTWLLPRVVGMAKACELAFTGDTMDADEALRLGIVSRVVAPEALLPAALELAQRIAAGPPIAIRLAKRSLYQGIHGSFRDALAREASALNVCMETDDAREGLLAFVEKRAPVFKGS
ncbi:MAG: 2-(1,2-epoxy,2-dihydrophenyl)acetyl-CoA isomerase [Rhizobacter sp.]|nr:2-(1,2-epoxy,2-dihydrophenyl)acetyl-CoA isomerase [Rhizobacter sp.]